MKLSHASSSSNSTPVASDCGLGDDGVGVREGEVTDGEDGVGVREGGVGDDGVGVCEVGDGEDGVVVRDCDDGIEVGLSQREDCKFCLVAAA